MLVIDVIDHRQQATEVDDALAQLDVVIRAETRRILDMKERVSASVPLHVLERILAANRRIAGVELQRHHRWISALDKHVVRSRPADRAEIPGFVVKADSDIAAQGTRSRFIETVSPPPVIIQTELLAVRQAGDDQVLMTEDLRRIDLPIEIVEDPCLDVGRRSAQAIPVENRAQSLWRHSEIVHRAQELDFLVTSLCDVDERAFQIFTSVVAQCVQLDPDLLQPTRAC